MIEGIIYITYGVAAATVAAAAVKVRQARKLFTPPRLITKQALETDLPSVTVCIPARNEQHALADCLESVLRSNYEKLEIIVLDDASNDDTPTLIKSFAHEGVRFAHSKALPEGWLGRTHALQGLLKEASGSYVLFLDVDTRLAYNSIEQIVRYALSQRAKMVSIIPRRNDGLRASVIFSTLRFFLEVTLSKKSSPGSSGAACLVHRHTLDDTMHGFTELKSELQPEAALAARFAKDNAYRLLISSPELGVSYEKKWRSQLLTAVRLFFPVLKSQLSLSFLALLDLLIIASPGVVMLWLAGTGTLVSLLGFISALLFVLFACVYGAYLRSVWSRWWWLGALMWPLIVLQEATLVIASAIQYKRGAVTWKGRSIQEEAQN